MKYELPKSLKRHSFWCDSIKDFTNYSKCSKLCRNKNTLACWKKNVVADIVMDCDVSNEKESEGYARCPKCNSDYVVGCAFDAFMCGDCGEHFSMEADERKRLMGENYLEIDMAELNAMLDKIKE